MVFSFDFQKELPIGLKKDNQLKIDFHLDKVLVLWYST